MSKSILVHANSPKHVREIAACSEDDTMLIYSNWHFTTYWQLIEIVVP